MRVFAFADLDHPEVAWAVMRGKVVSADSTSSPRQGFISFMQAGMIEYQNNARIFNETVIELIRLRHFGSQVSRMRGIYFFRSRAEAEARIGDKDWPSYFASENLLEFELYHQGAFALVDSNWITFAPLDSDARIRTNDLTWISRYWAGEHHDERQPVWELVANGEALVIDTKVRRRCHDLLLNIFPDSHIPIVMARLASEVGTSGGQISPFLLRKDNEYVELIYVWTDSEFHDPGVIDKIASHPDAAHLGLLMSEREEWKSPDFKRWGRVFRFGVQTVVGSTDAVIPSIHHTGSSNGNSNNY